MILLKIGLNNIYNFKDFEVSFSYPKKITNSTIENECLDGHPNFRYKKAVILMGANATGKTCLGRAVKHACDFINTGISEDILCAQNNEEKTSRIELELVNDEKNLIDIMIHIKRKDPYILLYRSTILEKDSYETAHSKLEKIYEGPYDKEILKHTGYLNCKFAYPEIEKSLKTSGVDEKSFLNTLRAVIGTLDPTLENVVMATDLKNSYIIRRGDSEIIIQDGRLLNRELLSSGTREGIDIALFLSLMEGRDSSFYYCDEHFSYIQTEVEKKIFQIMLRRLKNGDQLIFTTHNIDMLDLNLPKHSFALMRRNADQKPEIVFASSLLKRNTDSVRCAVENDAFSSIPDLSLLDSLE